MEVVFGGVGGRPVEGLRGVDVNGSWFMFSRGLRNIVNECCEAFEGTLGGVCTVCGVVMLIRGCTGIFVRTRSRNHVFVWGPIWHLSESI